MNKDKLVFWVTYPIIFTFSLIPLWLLYRVSSFFYYIIYYVVGYRKKVVRKNLSLCFPEKSAKERLTIEKKSYRHFTNIFVEMLKGFTISQKEISKRYHYTNPEIFKSFENNQKSVILLGAHFGNWEWLLIINSQTNLECYGAYTKIKNKYFDNYVKTNRSRFGCHFVQTRQTIAQITKNYRNNTPSIFGLLSDQTPHLNKTHHWAPFFGHVVPVHTGAEMLAKRFEFSIVYMHVKMPKRGYYEITFELLGESLKKGDGYPITDMYLRKLEKDIQNKPELYFWTHNRFKYLGKNPKIN